MPVTKRGLKRARSQLNEQIRNSRFTAIVNNQQGLCWYCGTPMGADCSREHLLAQVLGGTNDYPEGNLKATHKECNTFAGHLSVKDKYRLRTVGHNEGREEMLRLAIQLRRADSRMAFSIQDKADLRSFQLSKDKIKSKSTGYWRRFWVRKHRVSR